MAASSSAGPSSSGAGKPKSRSKFTMRTTTPASMPGQKRKRADAAVKPARGDRGDDSEEWASEEQFDEADEEDEGYELNTDDEIEAAQAAGARSKKTAKRKRRATSPETFGLALQSLLGDSVAASAAASTSAATDDAPSKAPKSGISNQGTAILSLAPHLRRSAHSTQLNARAARIALEQRRAREEKARVRDVIGGWGPPGVVPDTEGVEGGARAVANGKDGEGEELQAWLSEGGTQGYERKLRKVAQRGVVKLFNAIRAAQTTTSDDLEAASALAAGKSSTSASKRAPNALGGKEAALTNLSKNNFLDLIRAGTGRASAAAK